MLTANEISSMRTTASQALPGTAVIQRDTFVSDEGGGGSQTWAASGTVACRVAPIRGDEREVAERISAEADYIITLPAETTIAEDDRVVISSETYEVQAIRDRDQWEITRRVEAAKVD
jgi:SPP1 family predicted phage head-tail adaptor